MINLLDINIKAQIAFGLALIAGLLVYIAFYRDNREEKRHTKKPLK